MKVATVFSGIGAIEQALKRLNIEHDILFACDNGNIDIDINTDEELKKIRKFNTIKEKKEYVDSLYQSLSRKKNFVKESYISNYQVKNDYFFQDIKLLDGYDFKNNVDLFVGGSPCQSFSIAGQRLGFEDTRGTLFYDFVRLIKEINPKVFIFENVYGLYRHDKGRTWKTIKNVFDDIGYHYKYEILDSRDYGIPQGRRRVFVVGFKDKASFDNFVFPDKIDLKYTMQDFLIDNIQDGDLESINGKLTYISKRKGVVDEKYFLSDKLRKYVLSPGTKNFMHHNAKIDLPVARALLSTMGNTHRASVNNYITTNGKIRALTEREALRLMGFPDSFQIVVSKAQAYKQAGNSIVVDVLMAIVEKILFAMEENKDGKN